MQVTEMLNDIKNSFKSLVHDGSWIDPETKKAAQEKAESIKNFIGYQEWLLKPGQLDEYYSSVCSTLNFSVFLLHHNVSGFGYRY
jgi:predicted metalloendopeptidase